MNRFILISFLVILSSFTASAQYRDSIFLFNGQVLIGELKNQNLGVVLIDDKDLKYVNVKAYKIKHIIADHSVFRVETIKKRVYYTSILRTERPGMVRINSGDSTLEIPIADIFLLTPLQKNFFKRLDGNFGLGFSFSKSSKIGQINTNATVSYTDKKFAYQLLMNALSSIDSSKFSRDNENLQLFASYDVSKSWFLAAQVIYQRNLELSIARRFQEMLGAGNKVLLKDHWQIWAISGLSIGQEKSTENMSKVTLEIPVMLRINFFKYSKPNLQLTSNQALYTSLSEAGRVRYDGNFLYSQEIVHNFNVNLSFYVNYDSRPPDASNSNVDYGTALSIAIKF